VGELNIKESDSAPLEIQNERNYQGNSISEILYFKWRSMAQIPYLSGSNPIPVTESFFRRLWLERILFAQYFNNCMGL
jgi:hypothetical protein